MLNGRMVPCVVSNGQMIFMGSKPSQTHPNHELAPKFLVKSVIFDKRKISTYFKKNIWQQIFFYYSRSWNFQDQSTIYLSSQRLTYNVLYGISFRFFRHLTHRFCERWHCGIFKDVYVDHFKNKVIWFGSVLVI